MKRWCCIVLALAATLGMAACEKAGNNGEPVVITETRDVETPQPMESSDPKSPMPSSDSKNPGAPAQAPHAEYAWDTPEGWTEKPATSMRAASFSIGPNGEIECALFVGIGGSLEANVTRWRGQVGQAPLSSAELAALEKAPMMGVEATLLDATGDFSGDGAAPLEGAGILAAMCEVEGTPFQAKMIGPAALVAEQKAAFMQFIASVKSLGHNH
jgi:hypothetical protein